MDQQYWKQRYEKGETGWDVGFATPPLTQYADQLEDRKLRILIPGCGNAYEGEYLMRNGFTNTFIVDLVAEVLEGVQRRFPDFPESRLIHGDFFALKDCYDLILEQTFFCALKPNLRPDYVKQVNQLLKPGGRLVGVLFNREFSQEGPPFGGSEAEYRQLFSNHFEIHTLKTCYNSIKPRQGTELFINFRKPAT